FSLYIVVSGPFSAHWLALSRPFGWPFGWLIGWPFCSLFSCVEGWPFGGGFGWPFGWPFFSPLVGPWLPLCCAISVAFIGSKMLLSMIVMIEPTPLTGSLVTMRSFSNTLSAPRYSFSVKPHSLWSPRPA